MAENSIQQEIAKLRNEIRRHDYLYYVLAQPEIEDFDYDQLMRKLQDLEEQHPELMTADSPTQRVGGEPVSGFRQVTHSPRMLSLANCYTVEELQAFDERLRKIIPEKNIEYVCELKIDGVALSLTYADHQLVRAATRGNGEVGDDITANVRTIKAIPLSVPDDFPPDFEVRGEVYYPKADFEQMNKARIQSGQNPFMNPRNGAAGTLKMLDSRKVAKRPLRFFAYSLLLKNLEITTHWELLNNLKAAHFPVEPNRIIAKDIDSVEQYWKKWDEQHKELPYEADGVVVKLNNIADQQEAGYTAKSPRWAIAFKYSPVNAITTINDVKWQVGRTGTITPVAEMERVLLLGTWVKRATLHNYDEIKRLDVRIGDRVEVKKGGEIIPKVVRVVKEDRGENSLPIDVPEQCPVCDTELEHEEDGVFIRCPNWKCPAQIKGRIEHFASRGALDIDGLGSKTVDLLVSNEMVEDAGDLYFLTAEKVKKLPGFSDLSAENLINGLNRSKSQPFDRILFALGIKHVGSGAARLIAAKFPDFESLQSATVQELVAIDEVGSITAEAILQHLERPEVKELIGKLIKSGITGTQKGQEDSEQPDQNLEGLTFVLTGALENFTRDEAAEEIRRRGGRVTSSVSKKTSYVLVGKDPGSKKVKAEKFGIKILDEAQFRELINR